MSWFIFRKSPLSPLLCTETSWERVCISVLHRWFKTHSPPADVGLSLRKALQAVRQAIHQDCPITKSWGPHLLLVDLPLSVYVCVCVKPSLCAVCPQAIHAVVSLNRLHPGMTSTAASFLAVFCSQHSACKYLQRDGRWLRLLSSHSHMLHLIYH